MNLPITHSQLAEIIYAAKAGLVQHLITENKDDFDLISTAQAAGILDVRQQTLSNLPIPRYVVAAGKIVKYRISDIKHYLETIKE